MLGLLEKGAITQDQMNAAEAIRTVWQALLVAMSPVRPLDGTSRGGGIVKSPLERIGDKAYDHWRGRYLPWAKRERRIFIRPWLDSLTLTLAVVVDNQSLRDMDRIYGLRKESAKECIVSALDRWKNRDRENLNEAAKSVE